MKYIMMLKKYALCKKIMKIVYMFFFEYITNHIINKLPVLVIRNVYYKYILKLKFTSKAYINMGCYIYPSFNNLDIGDYTIINQNCILDRRGGISIGSNVNISREVAIYTAGHEINSPSFRYYDSSVKIEDYVWLGTRAMVMPGVTIGKGAMIMPGSIVTKNVEEYSIIAGIPARKIGDRNRDLQYTLTWREYFV